MRCYGWAVTASREVAGPIVDTFASRRSRDLTTGHHRRAMKFTELPCSPREEVRLRHLTYGDVPAWFAYLSRKEVFEHTSWDVKSPESLLPLVWDPAHDAPDDLLRLAVVGATDDRLVGTIGFHTVSAANRTAEIAYDFSPTVWGQGIASAVCGAVVAWGHQHVRLLRIQATVLKSNTRSQRVLERCGFGREGLLRSYRMVRGNPGDFFIYAHLAVNSTRARSPTREGPIPPALQAAARRRTGCR